MRQALRTAGRRVCGRIVIAQLPLLEDISVHRLLCEQEILIEIGLDIFRRCSHSRTGESCTGSMGRSKMPWADVSDTFAAALD